MGAAGEWGTRNGVVQVEREGCGSTVLGAGSAAGWRRMIDVRAKDTIYHKEGGWFSANWHFSFDEYYDPENMGFGTLRVFNDDRLVPGAAWPVHPHRDIEGLTYVVEGTFEP